jgi:hypothetical protein
MRPWRDRGWPGHFLTYRFGNDNDNHGDGEGDEV